MHQGYLAIIEGEINNEEIFGYAQEMLSDDFIEGDEVEEGFAIRDPLGDYLVVGGRYYDLLITEKESEEAIEEERKEKEDIMSRVKNKNDTMEQVRASIKSEEKMCRKYACRKIDKYIYDRILYTKKQFSDLVFLDYVNEKITEEIPSFKSIKGQWVVIIDVHS